MGDNVNVYNILQLRDTIGYVKCLALPFHHAFTGCDSTSIFYSQGNVNSWRDGWKMESITIRKTATTTKKKHA